MAVNDKKDVFISYCTKDSALTQYLCSLLEGSGINCWIAPRDIPSGEDWAGNIVKGLEGCKLVVFLVSDASVASNEVAKEINLANSFKRDILQVRLENAPLPPALMYHLSNKQWVDALGEEKSTRFDGAVSAIRKSLDKNVVEVVVSDTSVIGQARKLVDQLRKTHGIDLDAINATFTLKSEENDQIYISLPIRVGANGVVLVFKFDGTKKTLRIYADTAYDGDPIKDPFCNIITKYFKHLFSNTCRVPRARRWEFIEFVPNTVLTNSLVNLTAAECFEQYKTNVLAFSEKVLPKLLQWGTYVANIEGAINRLQEELRILFPADKGWKVGAPEGWRLEGFRRLGKINVFKEAWEPKNNNYKGRGLLSFTLESGKDFLDDLYIGVLKYEEWNDLGEWADKLHYIGTETLNSGGGKTAFWPCRINLDEPWNNSGIAQGSITWKDNLDGFIQHCLEKFKALKNLENDIDEACKMIPGLQDKDPAFLPVELQQNWFKGHLYIRNRMRLIAENVAEIVGDHEIAVAYRFYGNERLNDILLKFNVENFETAVSFRFNHRGASIAIINLEAPDFETPISNQFIAKFFPETMGLLKDAISTDKDCDGKTLVEWMDTIQSFILVRSEKIAIALNSLRHHLLNVVALTTSVTNEIGEILRPENGWTLNNKAKCLESESINIYNSSWQVPGQYIPPIMLQIYSEAPCFDKLHFVVKYNGQICPEIERSLGMIYGACNVAFGSCDEKPIGLWSKKFDNSFHTTGGGSFDKNLIDGHEKENLGSYLKDVANKVTAIKSMLDSFCSDWNKSEKSALVKSFWAELKQSVDESYPAADWKVVCDEQGEGQLLITRPDWNNLFKIGFGRFTEKTFVGLWCDNNDENLNERYQIITTDLKATNKKMRNDRHSWPGWYFTDRDFSQERDSALLFENNTAKIIAQYQAMLNDVVQTSLPIIEQYLGRTDETPALEETSSVEVIVADVVNASDEDAVSQEMQ